MSFIDGPYSLALQVLLTLLIIELGWGIAVLVGWLFRSMSIFYAVGAVATVGSIIVSYYWFTQETEQESKEPSDIF